MRKEMKIGLAGIAALLLLFFGINYLKGINLFQSERFYYVDFTNINGLAQSSPVFANGLKVGIVQEIEYNYQRPGHVTVGIEMDQNMKIPTGSKAEIMTEMLGTVKMNLLLNLDSSTYCNEGDTLIGISNEGIMGAAEKELLPKLNQILPKVDSVMTSLHRLLSDPALAGTLRNAEQLTASLHASSRQLNRVMSNDLPKLMDNATAITDNLRSMTDNLKGVDYAATFSKVDSTLQNVQLLTEKLNRRDNTMGLLMNDPAFYENLNATAANAASLLKDLQEHPKRYVHFSLFGRKDKKQ